MTGTGTAEVPRESGPSQRPGRGSQQEILCLWSRFLHVGSVFRCGNIHGMNLIQQLMNLNPSSAFPNPSGPSSASPKEFYEEWSPCLLCPQVQPPGKAAPAPGPPSLGNPEGLGVAQSPPLSKGLSSPFTPKAGASPWKLFQPHRAFSGGSSAGNHFNVLIFDRKTEIPETSAQFMA